jgi:hypothetical protein
MYPNQQQDEGQVAGGDLLVGANAIRGFLVYLGMPEGTDPYYLKRTGHWPIHKTSGDGGSLIASKRLLARHANKLARGAGVGVTRGVRKRA